MKYCTDGDRFLYLYLRINRPVTELQGVWAYSLKELFELTKEIRADKELIWRKCNGVFGFRDGKISNNEAAS